MHTGPVPGDYTTPVMELPEFAWPNTLVQPGMEHGPANVQPATAVRLPNQG